MRYRMEMGDDADLLVKHVHTDRVVAKVRCFKKPDPKYPALHFFDGCALLDADGLPLMQPSLMYDHVKRALEAVGMCFGLYPVLNDLLKEPSRTGYCEVEYRLGMLVVDAVTEVVRGLIESHHGGLSTETKERFGMLMQQLYEIWSASLVGSHNAECKRHEPYFASRLSSSRRLDFAQAVQEFGMWELTCHFPDVPEPILRELLMFVLKRFEDVHDTLVPREVRERRLKYAVPVQELARLLNTVAPRGASIH